MNVAQPKGTAEITLMIATDRPALIDTLHASLLKERNLGIVGAPIAVPSTLRDHLVDRLPAVLLLDQDFLDHIGPGQPLHLQFPELGVLLVSDAFRPDVVERVVANQFRGFILANEPDLWPRAIRRVAQGEPWLPRSLLADAVYRYLQRRRDSAGLSASTEQTPRSALPLTDRELEVVHAVRGGLPSKQIAEDLGIEEDTVKQHLRNVYRKLGIRRRAQLLLARVGRP